MPKSSHLTRGYSIALISAVFLSTTSIMIRYLTQTYQLPALILAFWRAAFLFLIILPIVRLAGGAPLREAREHLPYLVVYGLMLAIFNSIWTLSVSINGAAVATVLAYCSAGFTALLGWLVLKERLGWGKILAVVLSLAGCTLVSNALTSEAWRMNMAGITTGVLTGLLYAIYTLMGRSASLRGLNPWTTLVTTFGFAAIFLLAFNLIPGGLIPGAATRPGELLWLGKAWEGWALLILLAAGPTAAGFGLYNVSLSYLPSSVVNLVVTMEPVFTATFAYLLLGERLSSLQLLGGLLILGGVAFLRVSEGRAADPETAPGEAPGRIQAPKGETIIQEVPVPLIPLDPQPILKMDRER
jgi:drug/metabolite transporter (DMT)-like permease